jgi:hypothetical protein
MGRPSSIRAVEPRIVEKDGAADIGDGISPPHLRQWVLCLLERLDFSYAFRRIFLKLADSVGR